MHLPLVPNSQIRPPSSASRYNLAISELTGTEASYVHALQLFCLLRHLVRENALLDNQTLDEVFGNIDALLKFHKSFLKTAEDVSLLPEDQQCWGPVFSAFLDVADLYVDYIGNHRVHLKAAIREHDKLSVASWPPQVRQLVAGTEMIHHTFLRPYSRFAKYSVFLKEIHRGTQCETKRADLESAISLHHSILSKAGEALDTMARGQAVSDLHNRIEDWKHHNPATFGRLLLFDAFLCRPKKELEPALQFNVYLFEHVLLFCKEKKTGSSNFLRLKGRIYLKDVVTVDCSDGPPHWMTISYEVEGAVQESVVQFPAKTSMDDWAERVKSVWRRR